ncbi:DUF2232 domain-containing protein [Hathewaya massiliensis]|uniref:DUF2232 domain-containing protein n=1 Tax=Hathewaya massiliensis TaxID=1964382 RepID=UPI00115A7ED6|nr:DUF2232 domain-containing protein [Hathewaya massiliensis]
MVKNLWKNTGNIETFLILFLAILVMIISGNGADANLTGILVLPIPITLFYLKFEFKNSLWFLFFTSIINYILFGPFNMMSSILLTATVGIIFGYCIKKEKNSINTVNMVTLIAVICVILNILIYLKLKNVDIVKNLENVVNILKGRVDQGILTYKNLGMSETNIEMLKMLKELISVKLILGIIPAMMTFYILGFITINYFIIQILLKNAKVKGPKQVGFSRFYVTNLVGAFLIALTCIGVILDSKGFGFGGYLEISFISILQVILIINGMATLTYVLREKGKKSRKLVFFFFIIIFLLRLQEGLFYIGFIEMIFNFRGLDPYSIRKKKMGA